MARSGVGTGGSRVDPLGGGWLRVPVASRWGALEGRATVVELGVGATVAVRRYA